LTTRSSTPELENPNLHHLIQQLSARAVKNTILQEAQRSPSLPVSALLLPAPHSPRHCPPVMPANCRIGHGEAVIAREREGIVDKLANLGPRAKTRGRHATSSRPQLGEGSWLAELSGGKAGRSGSSSQAPTVSALIPHLAVAASPDTAGKHKPASAGPILIAIGKFTRSVMERHSPQSHQICKCRHWPQGRGGTVAPQSVVLRSPGRIERQLRWKARSSLVGPCHEMPGGQARASREQLQRVPGAFVQT
jgi:hypothetical protein